MLQKTNTGLCYIVCRSKQTLRKSHISLASLLQDARKFLSFALWPCHAFPSVAFLALRQLHWYRDLVWVFSQLGCLLEALWPCEFLIHPTALHVCAGKAASSRPKTQQQAQRAGLRRIASPISLSPSTGTSPVDTLIAIWAASMQSTSVELQCLKSDLNH